MFTMMSFKYVAYESKHFFKLKYILVKTVMIELMWEVLSMKFRDKLMPMVCLQYPRQQPFMEFQINNSFVSW